MDKKIEITHDGIKREFIISSIPEDLFFDIIRGYTDNEDLFFDIILGYTDNYESCKFNDYHDFIEKNTIKMMNYVQLINIDGSVVRLRNKEIIEKNIPDWEILLKIELSLMGFNQEHFKVDMWNRIEEILLNVIYKEVFMDNML